MIKLPVAAAFVLTAAYVLSQASSQSSLMKTDHRTSAVARPTLNAAARTASTMSQPIPRTTDGRPDFSGFWQVLNTADRDILDHQAEKGEPAGQGIVEGNEIPYQPWALAKKRQNFDNRATADPLTKCNLPGVPRITYTPLPFQVLQAPKQLTLLYEYAHGVRTIYTNGSDHPSGHIDWWLGDSRGHWDGETLIVDLVDFNDQTWFDRAGDFHSDELHVVERYSFLDADHINYEAIIEDPKVFTRPWRLSTVLYRRREKNFQLLEYECYSFDVEKYYP